MSSDDPLLGVEVGRFRLTRLLGRGGMGRVYLGVHPGIGSRVAVKVLAEDCADQPELIERFFTEARAVNLIHHENIVAITDLDRLPGGRPYIVMEYVEGRTLRELLAATPARPLPLGGVAEAMLDVLDALDAAHAAGIVHRDLKPDNVMVSPSGRAKVLDFGIAKLVDAPGLRTATGVALGTPHYMAPEQITGAPCDARTDVYAAGVMLFELATGGRPFDAATDFALMEHHLRTPPPRARTREPALPEPFDALIQRALAKDPADRWPSAAAMADALRAAVAATEPGVRPPFASAALKPRPLDALAPGAGRASAPTTPLRGAPRGDEIATAADGPRRGDSARKSRREDGRATGVPGPASPRARWPLLLAAVVGGAVVATAVWFGLAAHDRAAPTASTSGSAVTSAPGSADAVAIPEPMVVRDSSASEARVEDPWADAGVAAVSPAIDAGLAHRPDASPPRSSRGDGAPGHRCPSGDRFECPIYSCDCKSGEYWSGSRCDHGTCLSPSQWCADACQAHGGYAGTYDVQVPREERDCRAGPACAKDGACMFRHGYATDNDSSPRCLVSCRNLASCATAGVCSDNGTEQCVATDADCQASANCKIMGACVAKDGVCVPSDEGCARSVNCQSVGSCALGPAGCTARDDASCAASEYCKKGGRCVRAGTICAPRDTAACAAAEWCTLYGACTARDDNCVVTDASCRASDQCTRQGRCRAGLSGCQK